MATTEERNIICPLCAGVGCDDCDDVGTIVIDAPARSDGLPWHPHAVEGPAHLVAPAPNVRRRRGGGLPAEPAARPVAPSDGEDIETLERERLERENAELRERLARATASPASA